MGELLLTPGSTLTLASVYHRSTIFWPVSGPYENRKVRDDIEMGRVTDSIVVIG